MTSSGAISARIRARCGTCSGPWASRPLALIDRAVPAAIRITEPLALAEAKSERETLSYLRRTRDRNRVFISMLGMGYYGTVVPAVIRRNVLENPGWYTAHTPYQAEVSQGPPHGEKP